MTQISNERLAEMLAEVEIEQENAIADAEADQNPQLAIDAVAEFDLSEMRSLITELQALRASSGVEVKPFAYTTQTSLDILETSPDGRGMAALFLPFDGMDAIKDVTFPAEKRGSEWQPIETAPRDGTEFQAWISAELAASYWEPKCRFNPDSEAFELWGRVDYDADGWDTYPNLTPTHWMPEPRPPAIRQLGESHEIAVRAAQEGK